MQQLAPNLETPSVNPRKGHASAVRLVNLERGGLNGLEAPSGIVHALSRGGAGLTGRAVFLALVTWASARRTRSSPGYQISGFQPEDRPPGELKALRRDCFGGLKARNLTARGEAPGNLSSSSGAAL
jgi:hypothetical protein